MKKFIIGLVAVSSLSAFANTTMIRKVNCEDGHAITITSVDNKFTNVTISKNTKEKSIESLKCGQYTLLKNLCQIDNRYIRFPDVFVDQNESWAALGKGEFDYSNKKEKACSVKIFRFVE